METKQFQKPSGAFIAASWIALFTGIISYIVGLWNAQIENSEKGYYFTILLYGLFSAISLQKAVRDQLEGIQVTNLYFGLAWFATISSIFLLIIGLWNSTITYSEKGFYGLAFGMCLFAAIAVQKNTRDLNLFKE